MMPLAMRLAAAGRAVPAAHLPQCQALPYTLHVPAHQGRWLGGQFSRRNSRAGYPNAAFCCTSCSASTGGRGGRGENLCRNLEPVRQPATSPHQHLAVSRGGFLTCPLGAIHG